MGSGTLMGPVMELRNGEVKLGTTNTERPRPWLQAALKADSQVTVTSGVNRT